MGLDEKGFSRPYMHPLDKIAEKEQWDSRKRAIEKIHENLLKERNVEEELKQMEEWTERQIGEIYTIRLEQIRG